jgi:vacuolar-type H+-ATPase subunit H
MTKGMNMESTVSGNFAKTSQALADKATDKVQAGIRSAQQSVQEAGDSLSSKMTEAHNKAAPVIRKASGRAQSTVQQGFDTVSDIADQARDIAASTADSIVSYTKRNPLQALAMAAVSGALVYVAMKALRSYRD